MLGQVPDAAVAAPVLAHVGNSNGCVRHQLVLQREVDFVDVFRRQVRVDGRPPAAEIHTGGALLVQLGAQLVRAIVDPVAVRVEERVPDPGGAGRIGVLVGVGQVEVVAAIVPPQHRARRQRERHTQPRRPGVPDGVGPTPGSPAGEEVGEEGRGDGVQEVGALLLVAYAQVQRQPVHRLPGVLDEYRMVPVPVVGGDLPRGRHVEEHDPVHVERPVVGAVVEVADVSGIGVRAEAAAVDLELVA